MAISTADDVVLPCRVFLLRVRPFQVSGGQPPPPEQTPGNRVKTYREDSLSQTKRYEQKTCRVFLAFFTL